MSLLLLMVTGCGISRNTSALSSDTGGATDCLVHVAHTVDDLTCTVIEQGDGTPVIWFGRDVNAEHPLSIRLRTDDPAIVSALETAATAWSEVLASNGVLLAYEVDAVVDPFACALETLEDLPAQVAGFCIATPDEWSTNIASGHQDDAYVTRLNSPCDGTLRGSMTVLHPLWADALTPQAIAKALGHLTSVVAIDHDAALMADHWEGEDLPQDGLEGVCAAWQYRELED